MRDNRDNRDNRAPKDDIKDKLVAINRVCLLYTSDAADE